MKLFGYLSVGCGVVDEVKLYTFRHLMEAFESVAQVIINVWIFIAVVVESGVLVVIHRPTTYWYPPRGGLGYPPFPSLESQGCHLIPLYHLLSCSSAKSSYPFCLICFLPAGPFS